MSNAWLAIILLLFIIFNVCLLFFVFDGTDKKSKNNDWLDFDDFT